jgi:hypothetical protein
VFDGFFMLNGLWLAPVAIYLGGTESDPNTGLMNDIYLVLTALFWIGHRVSSAHIAYCTTAYRPLLTSQRTRFVWVPLGIVAAVFLFLVPEGGWPWTRAERLMTLVIADFLLITYHFASQHYGVLSLYRVRAGQPRTRAAKRLDRTFAFGVGGVLVIVVDSMVGTESFQEIWLHSWVSSNAIENAWGTFTNLATVVVVAATMLLISMELRTGRACLPRTLYFISVSLVVLTAFWVHPFVFVVLWTVQHWTAAMGLALVVARPAPDPGRSPWYRFWHTVNQRPWLLLALLMIGSAVLLPVMEVEAVEVGERYSSQLVPWLAETLAASPIAPVLIAVGFATALLHYQLDRAVFRLSDLEVRRAVGVALLEREHHDR